MLAGAAAIAVAATVVLTSPSDHAERPFPGPPASAEAALPLTREPVAKPYPRGTATAAVPAPLGRPRLHATIGALGALVRARPGIVGMRLRNSGAGPSGALEAAVALPPGVTVLPAGGHGTGVALIAPVAAAPPARVALSAPAGAARPVGGRGGGRVLDEPVGTVDGWVCRAVTTGARCARGPLRAGQGTALFLRVQVAVLAPQGAGPAVRIRAGSLRVDAHASAGVGLAGAPARFATDGKVAVNAIGNSLLSCPEADDGCAEARQRAGDRRDNDLWPMTALDQDDSAATGASSGARLDLPENAQIVWAGLYWSAAVLPAGPIKIRPPGRKRYLEVLPGEVMERELPSGPGYQAFADVTALVSNADRDGVWWAADPPMAEGISRHAGWSLVVISTDPAQPYSHAVVLDTATVVGGARDLVRIPLGGLGAPGAPARAELVTWEGDADLAGDKVSLGAGPLVPASGGRDAGNVFDGSSNGAGGMTFGVDVDTFRGPLGAVPALGIASGKDAVLFGIAAVSVRARS